MTSLASSAHSLKWLTQSPIAHRGLHDGNIAIYENSLPAARAAMAAGYAIECDVLLSKDRTPVIFHDDTLDRLTHVNGRLSDRTLDELRTLSLGPNIAQIPTVQEFLRTVAGQVPIVMELKGTSVDADRDFVANLLPILSAYTGKIALMSFDEWLIDHAIAANACPVGLTAEGKDPQELDRHRAIYERGCSFTSYNIDHQPNEFTGWVRDSLRHPVISWTVRDEAAATRSASYADQMTFEGFLPRL